MRLAELERHPRHQGCVLYREGGAHSIWFNPTLHKIASVPRHREIKEGTVRAICRVLHPWFSECGFFFYESRDSTWDHRIYVVSICEADSNWPGTPWRIHTGGDDEKPLG